MIQFLPTPSVPRVSVTPRSGRWRRWGLWVLVAVVAVAAVALALLDPWLRRTLEKQVATASQGRYQLTIGKLRTRLWSRTLVLTGVHLRSEPKANNKTQQLPALTVDLGQLRVAGIGLGALLGRGVVPIDSVVLTDAQLRVGEVAQSAPDSAAKPLYSRLPLGLAGLRVGYVGLQRVKARYGDPPLVRAQFEQANLTIQDLNLSAAGAADTTRLGYAAAATADVRGLLARASGHVVRMQHGAFSTRNQRLTLDSVRVVPLQVVSNQRTQAARADITLPQLTLSGVRAAGLLQGRFRADDLQLAGLRLLATAPAVPPAPPHQLLAPYLPDFHLKRLRLTQGQVQVLGLDRAPAVQDVNLTGFDLRPQPDTKGQLYYARAWTLRTGRGRLNLDFPYYRLVYQRLEADTRRGQLRVTNVALAPTMPVAKLAQRKGHQSVHARVRLPQVQVSGLDMEALVEKGSVVAQEVTVRNGRIITESDGRFSLNPVRSVATPDAIGRLSSRVDVRRLRVVDLGIRMSYRSPRSPQLGALAIQALTGTLSNISNDPRRMSAAQPLVGQVTGRVQKQWVGELNVRANLLGPSGAHTLTGVFGPAPLAMLNPMVLPTRGLRLRSGQVQQLRFQMQLDRTQVRGTMWATYQDLKLDLLNRQNRPGVLHRLETSLVNGIFLRDNNPRQPGEELQTGSIESSRDLRLSVFSLWRQGLVSGMLNSAGVPKPLAKKLSEAK